VPLRHEGWLQLQHIEVGDSQYFEALVKTIGDSAVERLLNIR
jgi:hypothetical protein